MVPRLRRLVLALLAVAGCDRPCARHSDCALGERCTAESVCVRPAGDLDAGADDAPLLDVALPDAAAIVVDAAEPAPDASPGDAAPDGGP